MGADFITKIVTQTDEVARRLRRWNEHFIETKLASERRTIDVRVKHESDTKATRMAIKELQSNSLWLEQKEKRIQLLHEHSEERLVQTQKWLNLIGNNFRRTFNSTSFFYFVWTPALIFWTVIATMAVPKAVVCQQPNGICHQARVMGLSAKKAVFWLPNLVQGKHR